MELHNYSCSFPMLIKIASSEALAEERNEVCAQQTRCVAKRESRHLLSAKIGSSVMNTRRKVISLVFLAAMLFCLSPSVGARIPVGPEHSSRHHYRRHQSPRVRYLRKTHQKRVRRPVRTSAAPIGASAQCNDGTFSFSQNRRGTCSHHGGVRRWFR